MSLVALAAWAVAAIAGFLTAMAALKRLASSRGWPAEVQRKIIHVGTGLFAMALPWLFSQDWPIYAILALAMAVMALLRVPAIARRGLGTTLHGVDRRSYGDFMLAIAVALCLLFSQREPILYLLPLAVLTLGDAAAALAGSAYGRRQFQVEEGTKSLEGSTIFFLVTALIAMMALLLLTEVPRAAVILLALMVSAFATLVEADSWRGFDNLFLPMGVLIFLATNLQTSPAVMLAQAMTFVGALLVFGQIGARLGLSPHAARVYVVAVFLIVAVTDMHNVALPVAMLLTHALARIWRPCEEPYPDLDAVAGLAIASFGFLAIGSVLGPNALSFYALAMGGMAVALWSLAVSLWTSSAALAARALGGIAAVGLWAFTLWLNPSNVTGWHGLLWPWALGHLTLCLALPAISPHVFDRFRAGKITILGAVPPALLYLAKAMPGAL